MDKANKTKSSFSDNCLFAGFDVGSSFVHYAVLNQAKDILYCPQPIMHFANPIGAVKEAWCNIIAKFGKEAIANTAFTGSGAEAFPRVMPGVTYVYDSVVIPKGAGIIEPKANYIFHIGAKDSYFFNVREINGKKIIQEWKTGTKCGGGSGTLIEKQCRRFFEGEVPHADLEDAADAKDEKQKDNIRARNRVKLQERLEEMFSRAEADAEKATEPSEFLARCGVVIQSDLIHKQNEGATRQDNLAGLKALAEFLGIEIERPDHFQNVAAVGAAIKGLEDKNSVVFELAQLDEVAQYSREKRQFGPPLAQSLEKVNEKTEELTQKIPQGTEVVIGIDGGSTTTKGALVAIETGKLLDKLYIKTHGNPEESLKRVLKYLGRHRDNVVVKGVGATGSARKLYEKVLLGKNRADELKKAGIEIVDRITDEITCHALGVKYCDRIAKSTPSSRSGARI